jgi:hypothetical protein|tara:strand:- start:5455 stop:6873 length:1419 start_codon:yes stop_codon:yes gene_type:complete
MDPYREGNFSRAAAEINGSFRQQWAVKLDPEKGQMTYGDNAIIANLERGRILFDAGKFEKSLEAFELAETILHHDFDERAIVSVKDAAAETESLMVNQKAMPYSGFVYDRILLNTYKAMAAASAGDLERALVECRRVDETQEEAKRVFQKEAKGSKGSRKTLLELQRDDSFIKKHPELRGASIPETYRDFVNPFATLVKGVMRRIKNHPDETGEVDFRNLVAMLPGNREISAEYARIRKNESAAGTLYVIWENGLGPRRRSIEVAIQYGEIRRTTYAPSWEFSDYLDTAYLALPEFIPGRQAGTSLWVETTDGTRPATELIADMNAVERFEYQERMPLVLMREFARVIAQETMANEIEKSAKKKDKGKIKGDNDDTEIFWTIVAKLGALTYKSLVNQADDRCWRSLACNYQFKALPIPDNRRVRLSVKGGSGKPEIVELPDGEVLLLIVRSVNKNHLSHHSVGFPLGRKTLG